MNKNRETELDILRIIALLLVILIHAFAFMDTITGITRNVEVFIQSIITWQIPIYVMISGRFFLDESRNINLKKILKSIVRLIIAFLFWNILYQIYYYISGTYDNLNIFGILSEAIIGPYHFWYLHMIICLYLITPFLREIVKSKKLMELFILLFLLFEFLNNYGVVLPLIGNVIDNLLTKMSMHFVLGYSGYYILGYYLKKYPLTGKLEKIIYILGFISLIITGLLNTYNANLTGSNNEFYVKYLLPNVAIEAIAIYTFFINRISKINFSKLTALVTSKLYEYSFGVYLIHALILDLLGYLNIIKQTNSFIILFLIVILVFAISNILIALIRKIPVIGKKTT